MSPAHNGIIEYPCPVPSGMDFAEWDPVYEQILDSFGYDRTRDERVRDRLHTMFDEPFDRSRIPSIASSTVAIAGGGPSVTTDSSVAVARDADFVFAASTAVDRLTDRGVRVDCMVTDLDKNPETVIERTQFGLPVVVHAHGDNEPLIDSVVPRCSLEWVLPTTQAEPTSIVENFGGFTDGDRAAFLADAFGATRLRFVGWDFDDSTLSTEKRRKLRWAERLLHWLERRRGDTFAVLDGRRSRIDPIDGTKS